MSIWKDTPVPEVFRYFEILSSIPRPSGHTEAVSRYCAEFAKEHHLAYRRDAVGNVIIRKPASAGREKDPRVILQGHLDMVPAAEEGLAFDFEKDPIRLKIEGDFLTACGTTLGADDGIAVALCLAVLADENLSHPELICVLTIDEEVGMIGAAALDMSDLAAECMINIDNEVEGVLTVSCAGGVRARSLFPTPAVPAAGRAAQIRVSGFKGGHSGTEIHLNRVNACRFLAGLLREVLQKVPVGLISMKGGTADNAIPPMASAVVLLPAGKEEEALAVLNKTAESMISSVKEEEPDAFFVLEQQENAGAAVPAGELAKKLDMILSAPNGVQEWSREIDGLVQTSLNLGVINWADGELSVVHSIRSSVDESKRRVMHKIEEITAAEGGTITFTGDYPGWPVKSDSQLQILAKSVWKAQNDTKMKVEAIHAGVECGLFSAAHPDMDIISIGPDLFDVHTPRERLSLSSTARIWYFVTEILRRISI